MSTPNPVPTPIAAAVAVIAKEQPANGIICIHLRANNDPTSDSRATFHVQDGSQIDPTTKQTIPATTAADIQAWVAQEKARVAREYAAMTMTHTTLLDVISVDAAAAPAVPSPLPPA